MPRMAIIIAKKESKPRDVLEGNESAQMYFSSSTGLLSFAFGAERSLRRDHSLKRVMKTKKRAVNVSSRSAELAVPRKNGMPPKNPIAPMEIAATRRWLLRSRIAPSFVCHQLRSIAKPKDQSSPPESKLPGCRYFENAPSGAAKAPASAITVRKVRLQ